MFKLPFPAAKSAFKLLLYAIRLPNIIFILANTFKISIMIEPFNGYELIAFISVCRSWTKVATELSICKAELFSVEVNPTCALSKRVKYSKD
jgi:hypothetical protein